MNRQRKSKLTPGSNLLWESSRMMLPEHKEQILRHRIDIGKKERPLLDEQRLSELSHLLREAFSSRRAVAVVLYDPFSPRVVRGEICHFDPQKRQLKLTNGEESCRISVDDILDVLPLE